MNPTLLLLALFLFELLVIFLISKKLINSLSHLFLKITRSHKVTVTILSILFLPGTIVHELSHLLVAGILMVPVGEIDLLPEVEGEQVKLGSVQIGHTDPFRRMLIGVAPLILGLSAIIGMIYFNKDSLLHFSPLWLSALIIYLLFQITNTMFSSKKDLEGALVFIGAILTVTVIIVLALVFTGSMPDLSLLNSLNLSGLNNFFTTVDKFILVPLMLDLAVFGVIKLII